MSLLSLTGIEKTFVQGKVLVPALRGIDLEVCAGEFTALVGPSGSGKTTLLNVASGLDRPTAGSVVLDGRDLGSLTRSALSRLRLDRVGFVFQSGSLIPVLTAFENAEICLLLRGEDSGTRRRKVMDLLDAVGIAALAGRLPSELSGGEQQRVAVARALVTEPAIVFADEPTSSLDSASAAGLLDCMARLNRERGATFLFSTHDRQVMDRAARRVTLRDGRVVADE
jgi:putative ABC transport system ATP-binding protein